MDPTERLLRPLAAVDRLPRGVKRAIAMALDVGVLSLTFAAANASIIGSHAPRELGWLCAAAPAAAVPVFARLGLYRAVLRFISPKAIAAVVAGVSISVTLLGALDRTIPPTEVPAAALALYWSFALIYVGGSRFAARYALGFSRAHGARVVIYGAGEAGAMLVSALRQSREFEPVAFLDDDPRVIGTSIAGLDVFAPDALPALVRKWDVAEVLLAIPSASRRRRREILGQLEAHAIRVRMVPDLAEIVAGRARVGELREVQACDLLGREVVAPNAHLLHASIRGKAVLVTGAGGSIGSELCRQIAGLGPTRLVLVEQSEPALYGVEKSLRALAAESGPAPEIVALLGNAGHKLHMREILDAFEIETVYHAAAYKHVPIVEQNVIEGIRNNALATWRCAEAALEAEVETFVLVSTDKAVNPTNVMGASKRLAELAVQALQRQASRSRLCMVRFGNVLESSGSVVPLFREQIARGGPITVTHPEIIRYFMTIQEAASVVIQASALARGGDVLLLDMGEPVRIADLARRMVHLSGLSVRDEQHPEGDIEIRYTGLRPAEKLYEELLVSRDAERTEHPMIVRATERSAPWEQLRRGLIEMEQRVQRRDARGARELLAEIVGEYTPSPAEEDLVERERVVWGEDAGRAASLSSRRAVAARRFGVVEG